MNFFFFAAVTSCGPEVKNCPAKLGEVTTEIIALSTTVCPVTQSSVAPAAGAAKPSEAPKDVPSYQYSAGSSTAAMGTSPGAPVIASPSSRLVGISSSSHPSSFPFIFYLPLLMIKVIWLII